MIDNFLKNRIVISVTNVMQLSYYVLEHEKHDIFSRLCNFSETSDPNNFIRIW